MPNSTYQSFTGKPDPSKAPYFQSGLENGPWPMTIGPPEAGQEAANWYALGTPDYLQQYGDQGLARMEQGMGGAPDYVTPTMNEYNSAMGQGEASLGQSPVSGSVTGAAGAAAAMKPYAAVESPQLQARAMAAQRMMGKEQMDEASKQAMGVNEDWRLGQENLQQALYRRTANDVMNQYKFGAQQAGEAGTIFGAAMSMGMGGGGMLAGLKGKGQQGSDNPTQYTNDPTDPSTWTDDYRQSYTHANGSAPSSSGQQFYDPTQDPSNPLYWSHGPGQYQQASRLSDDEDY